LFLSCDMPFVSGHLLLKILRSLPDRGLAAFVVQHGFPTRSSKFKIQSSKSSRSPIFGKVGFPFILRGEALPVVKQQLDMKRHSLQSLATSLAAKLVRVPKPFQRELFNINTLADWRKAREAWHELARERGI